MLNGRVIPSPEKVVHARLNRGVWELLVWWVGRAPSDATWENLLEFKATYPSVQLADELFVGEGENVIDSFVGRKYYRKKKIGAAAAENQRG